MIQTLNELIEKGKQFDNYYALERYLNYFFQKEMYETQTTEDEKLELLDSLSKLIQSKLNNQQPKLLKYFEEDETTNKVIEVFEIDFTNDYEKLSGMYYWVEDQISKLFSRKRNQEKNLQKINTFKWENTERTRIFLHKELTEQKFILASYRLFSEIFDSIGVGYIRQRIRWMDKNKKGEANKRKLIILVQSLYTRNFISYHPADFNKLIVLCFSDYKGDKFDDIRKSKTSAISKKLSDYKQIEEIINSLRKVR